MREITITLHSVFVGNGYLQNAGGGWKLNHCLRYHVYFTLELIHLIDAQAFYYGRSEGVDGDDTAEDDSDGVEDIEDSGTNDDDSEGKERTEDVAENDDEGSIHLDSEEEVGYFLLQTSWIPDEWYYVDVTVYYSKGNFVLISLSVHLCREYLHKSVPVP